MCFIQEAHYSLKRPVILRGKRNQTVFLPFSNGIGISPSLVGECNKCYDSFSLLCYCSNQAFFTPAALCLGGFCVGSNMNRLDAEPVVCLNEIDKCLLPATRH